MLVYEYKLQGKDQQSLALEEAIRTTQFIRNKCVRFWKDNQGVNPYDLYQYCAVLAKEYDFAKKLNSQARQAASERASSAIMRFYKNCKDKSIRKKGYPQPGNLQKALDTLFGDRAVSAALAYPATTEVVDQQAATDLAGDLFIGYGTWKWYDMDRKTGGEPVYRYFFSRPRPGAQGAVHSAEIEYALGNLAGNTVYAWTPDDTTVSNVMQGYFADFIKTGDPNGLGLPH